MTSAAKVRALQQSDNVFNSLCFSRMEGVWLLQAFADVVVHDRRDTVMHADADEV